MEGNHSCKGTMWQWLKLKTEEKQKKYINLVSDTNQKSEVNEMEEINTLNNNHFPQNGRVQRVSLICFFRRWIAAWFL